MIRYTQPALFAHSLAVLTTGIKGPSLSHSLGELPALVHAGCFTV